MKSDETIANGVDVYMQAPDVVTVNVEFLVGAFFFGSWETFLLFI
jgi:hypothetical protein